MAIKGYNVKAGQSIQVSLVRKSRDRFLKHLVGARNWRLFSINKSQLSILINLHILTRAPRGGH